MCYLSEIDVSFVRKYMIAIKAWIGRLVIIHTNVSKYDYDSILDRMKPVMPTKELKILFIYGFSDGSFLQNVSLNSIILVDEQKIIFVGDYAQNNKIYFSIFIKSII